MSARLKVRARVMDDSEGEGQAIRGRIKEKGAMRVQREWRGCRGGLRWRLLEDHPEGQG